MTPTQPEGTWVRAVGELLHKARLSRGLTLRRLAEAVGSSASYISRVERGLEKPSPRFLRDCARALEMPDLLHIAEGLGAPLHQPEPEPPWDATAVTDADQYFVSPIDLAARYHIPVPPPEGVPQGVRQHHRLPPALARLLTQMAEQADSARTLASLYNRSLASYVPDANARDALARLVREVARLKFAEGATRGIQTTLTELRSAATYALYWALVPFLPPPHALWLHRLHGILAHAGYRRDLMSALLQVARLLASVRPGDIPAVLPAIRSAIREATGTEVTPAPTEAPTGRVPFYPRPEFPREAGPAADGAPAVPGLEDILSPDEIPNPRAPSPSPQPPPPDQRSEEPAPS